MNIRFFRYIALTGFLLAVAFFATSAAVVSPATAAALAAPERFIVEAKSASNYDGLRTDIIKTGGQIVRDLRSVNLMIVNLRTTTSKTMLSQDTRVSGAARDNIRRLISPPMQQELWGKASSKTPKQTVINISAKKPKFKSSGDVFTADPAFNLPGLMWNIARVKAPQTWNWPGGTGLPTIYVGVADTGLDYTHKELEGKVDSVADFTVLEEPYPICKTYLGGQTDAELATSLGAPSADLDFNGHGTWIGGAIAATADSFGINGIVPNVKLVSLKISQNCGSAWDSEMLSAFVYAADHGIDIVNISFGGYMNRRYLDSDALYRQYVNVVNYATTKGTVIVSSLGNNHARIGTGGLVLSHGTLTTPGDSVTDLFGMYQTPAGIPGVVAVSATNNIVNAASPICNSNKTGGDATCKPMSDKHQPVGAGKQNQLAYYSNYGPRVDVAAPGGARKFNLPRYDRGGTLGYPITDDDGWNAWGDFSITSNYATQIDCYKIGGTDWPDPPQCYANIQGTSMAAPHAAGVLAVISSTAPYARKVPPVLVLYLKAFAQKIKGNMTRPLSATDLSAGDLTGIKCITGYCHLGGAAISDREAYGAGLVDAYDALLALKP